MPPATMTHTAAPEPSAAPTHAPDGLVTGGLLPLVLIGGRLFVADNCLHFYPGAGPRPQTLFEETPRAFLGCSR